MTELVDRWTEERLEDLEPHEHDFQEFKGTAWMVTKDRTVHSNFPLFLSKQISAFANGAGGRVFIGIDDSGKIDGGVPVDLKGGGTRAWLEDIVPSVVDPPLNSCNVYEVSAERADSQIKPGRGIYVVEIPASSDAPHQSKDHRYYLRIAGKSRPMGHVHLQDVLRRTRHPQVTLCRFGPYGNPLFDRTDPRGPRAFIQFRAFMINEGRMLANHVGIELTLPRPFAGREVRKKMRESGEVMHTQKPGRLTFFRYHPAPLFPGQEVYAVSIWICLHKHNLAQVKGGAELQWLLYADDATPTNGTKTLWDYQHVQRSYQWIQEQLSSPQPS